MIEALASIAIAACGVNVSFVVWAVNKLWTLDRRVVRIETTLGLDPAFGGD